MRERKSSQKSFAVQGISIPDSQKNEFQDISVAEWVENFVDLYKAPPAVKMSTYSTYKRYCKHHIEPFFGGTPLAAIQEKHNITPIIRFFNQEARECNAARCFQPEH